MKGGQEKDKNGGRGDRIGRKVKREVRKGRGGKEREGKLRTGILERITFKTRHEKLY